MNQVYTTRAGQRWRHWAADTEVLRRLSRRCPMGTSHATLASANAAKTPPPPAPHPPRHDLTRRRPHRRVVGKGAEDVHARRPVSRRRSAPTPDDSAAMPEVPPTGADDRATSSSAPSPTAASPARRTRAPSPASRMPHKPSANGTAANGTAANGVSTNGTSANGHLKSDTSTNGHVARRRAGTGPAHEPHAPDTTPDTTPEDARAMMERLRLEAGQRFRPEVSAGAAPIRVMALMVKETEERARRLGIPEAAIRTGRDQPDNRRCRPPARQRHRGWRRVRQSGR